VQKKPLKTAYFYDPKILSELEDKSPEALTLFDRIYIPLNRLCEYSGSLAGIALPPIIFDSEKDIIEKMLAEARERGISESLISNISHKRMTDRHGFSVMGDFRLNITNSQTREIYSEMGIEDAILSPELTLPMARDIGGSVIVYGRIPLMLTERCFIRENYGCERCGAAFLTDRTGAKFPMLREFEHRNLILNSTPTYMGDKQDELFSARISSHHFLFFTESAKEISAIISSYKSKKPLPYAVRRIGKR
jgi:putative protease